MQIATRLPGERGLPQADAETIAHVRGAIIEAGDRWRDQHPLLAENQNAIGLAIFLLSLLAIALDGWLFATGVMPWWVCVPLSAFWMSLLHELEDDLIHWMYFRNRRVVHHAMMLGVWVARPSTINPWIRRRLHLHHHKVSGTESDLEERAITNGEGWGAHRLTTLLDSMFGLYTKPMRMYSLVSDYVEHEARSPAERRDLINMNWVAYFPLGNIYFLVWHAFIGIHLANLLGASITGSWVHALDVMAVALLAPNALRTFCLHFVSSNMHYYGDIEPHNVLKQTQVWTSPLLWPLHAFCFNFGGTHAIHHFLVRDPFYLRQAVAGECQQVLRAHGVRFNDFGTFRRANRWAFERVEV